MTVPSSSCPSGLEKVTSPKHLYRKTVTSGCSSAKFSTHGVPYTKVCGQVIGYKYNHTDGFNPYYANQGRILLGILLMTCMLMELACAYS